MVKARACLRCKEYYVLHPEVYNQNLERSFDKAHRGHNCITLELDEVKGKGYKNFQTEGKESEEK